MITGKQLLTGLLIAAFGSALSTVALAIDDVDPVADFDEQPAYSNPAQAMHAAQIAEANALQPNEETQVAADDLAAAREAFDEANTAYQEALDDPTADLEAMESALDAAAESLAEARGAYAEQVGALAGIRGQEIQAMRQSGMGWGLIAHELGVHPGVLGLGHGKRAGLDPADSPDDETVSATAPADPAAEIARATKRSAHAANRGLGLTVRDRNTAQKGIGLARASEVSAVGVTSSTSQPGKGVAAGRSAASGSQGIGVGLDAAGTGTNGIGSAGPGNSGKGDDGPGNSGKGDDGPGNSGKGNSGGGNGNGVGKK